MNKTVPRSTQEPENYGIRQSKDIQRDNRKQSSLIIHKLRRGLMERNERATSDQTRNEMFEDNIDIDTYCIYNMV